MRIGKWQLAMIVAGLVGSAPASASAATGWVSTLPVSAPYNSCSHPGYAHIAEAVAAPVSTVKVCPGTYQEQLQITRAVKLIGEGTVIVELPASPAPATTACDSALEAATGEGPVEDGISICGAFTVTISHITIDAAWPSGTCNDNLYGLNVGGGAVVKMSESAVTAAGAQPINGCQGGVGIEIGTHVTSPEEAAKVSLKEVSVAGYQKAGIDIDGADSVATLADVTVTGAGSTPEIAQDGIQVGYGGKASIRSSMVEDNEYEPETAAATGVLLYGAAAGTTLETTTIAHNGYGVYYADTQPSAPSGPQVKIRLDHIEHSRYDGVLLTQGWASVESSTLIGGEIGIGLYQYAGESYGSKGTGVNDTIEGMSGYAVYGYSDQQNGDPPGEFKISRSHISGNPPGATVAESVHSESPTLTIVTQHDT
jgi:hypothetical protein